MKKQLPTHDDTPSTPTPPKVIEPQQANYEGKVKESKHNDGEKGTPLPPKVVQTQQPNYEGEVRGTNYKVEEVKPDTRGTLPESKSDTYPIPDHEIDIYSVDDRIWSRLDGMGGDGGPHTHDAYAPKNHDHDDKADTGHKHDDLSPKSHLHPENAPLVHNHDGDYTSKDYVDDQDRAWDQVAQGYTDDALADHLANTPHGGGDGGSYDDTEVRGLIQDNTDAIAGKADDPHEHPIQPHAHDYDGNIIDGGDFTPHNHNGVYQPVGDYATKTELSDGLAGKADEPHTHPDPDLSGYVAGLTGTGMGLWIGNQADYDAVNPKRITTLYVVM